MSGIALDDFVAEAKRFLDANAEPRSEQKFVWGEGPDRVGILDEKTPEEEAEELRAAKDWKATEFDAGFGWITGPEEYGGRALDAAYQRAYAETQSNYAIPSVSPFAIGLGMVAPTILAHAIPEVKERYLRSLYRGDLVACQLFSEPAAGSDLAGIQTRADARRRRVGDQRPEGVDVGRATERPRRDHHANVGRQAQAQGPHDAPRRHEGARRRQCGRLRQMTGGASFNEVFFDEVRVHDSHRLGDVDEGWTVALTTLMNERAAIGGGIGNRATSLTRFVELARYLGRADDPLVRQQLADSYVQLQVARYTNQRAMAKIRAGQLPGPEMSIAKLAMTQNFQRLTDMLSGMLGPRLTADTGEWGTYAFGELVLGVPGMRVAGGTDEVMRNIVGERVLGLPKEPRANA